MILSSQPLPSFPEHISFIMHIIFYADDIKRIFVCFGSLSVDWPHKLQTKACVPPKGELCTVWSDGSEIGRCSFTQTLGKA